LETILKHITNYRSKKLIKLRINLIFKIKALKLPTNPKLIIYLYFKIKSYYKKLVIEKHVKSML